MSEPCMCGDTECPTCGVYQGTYLPEELVDAPNLCEDFMVEGYKAFWEGGSNPYPEDAKSHRLWDMGYESASIENDTGETASWL